MRKTLTVIATLTACATQAGQTSEDSGQADVVTEVSALCSPVTTSQPIQTGDVITTNLRGLTVENGVVRLRYGAHAMDFRDQGVTTENLERNMDHVMAARHTDDPSVDPAQGCVSSACHTGGTHWHDAVYPWYGDGITYSTAVFDRDADRVRVLRADADVVELSYEWDDLRLDGLRAPGQCVLGNYPQCGPTMRDVEGVPVYLRDGETIKSVKHADVWKTVRVERCTPGYFVSLRSDPPLLWPEQGSRSARIGYVHSLVAWSCDRTQVARHPEAGQHVSLGVTDCVGDLADPGTGHGGWPFARFMLTDEPTAFWSLQYSAGQLGSPGPNEVWDRVGADGRPQPWQMFIGAVEYVSPDPTMEPTLGAGDAVDEAINSVTWPE